MGEQEGMNDTMGERDEAKEQGNPPGNKCIEGQTQPQHITLEQERERIAHAT